MFLGVDYYVIIIKTTCSIHIVDLRTVHKFKSAVEAGMRSYIIVRLKLFVVHSLNVFED